jgi:hypothetical protein
MSRNKLRGAILLSLVTVVIATSVIIAQSRTREVIEAEFMRRPKRYEGILGQAPERQLLALKDFPSPAIMMKTPAVISRAITSANLQSAQSTSTQDLILAIREAISVHPDPAAPDTVFRLSYRGSDPEGEKIVSAIIASYQALLDETYQNAAEKTADYLIATRRKLSDALAADEADYLAFRKNAAFVGTASEAAKQRDSRLAVLLDKKSALLSNQADLEGRLAWLDKAVADKSQRLSALLQANEWAAKVGYEKIPREARPDNDVLQGYREFVKQQLAENRSIEKSLNQLLDAEQAAATALLEYELKEEKLRNSITATRELLNSVTRQLQEVSLEIEFSGILSVIISEPQRKKN